MGTATLVDREIQEGKRLIDALNQAGLSVNSALWLYLPEKETWRLILTSPLFDYYSNCDNDRGIKIRDLRKIEKSRKKSQIK